MGGKLKVMGLELEVPGLINTYQDYQKNKLDRIKQAKELADELGVPISELGIRIPRKLTAAIENKTVVQQATSNPPGKFEE